MDNFDRVIDRGNSLSQKWHNVGERFHNDDCIPMWVADTDFAAPNEVLQAFKKEIEHGVFGYAHYPDRLFEAVQGWLSRRHNFTVERNEIFFNNAVLPTISMIIKALTNEGDSILMHSPVYHPFFLITEEVNREVVFNKLLFENNTYHINFDEFEKDITQNDAKIFILSNPHNPGSRAWNEEELMRIVSICKKHKVIIISDEIHSDLTMPHINHVPTQTIAEDYEDSIITIMAPTKTFNIAGVKSSFYIVKNKDFQRRFTEAQRYIRTPELNNFAIVGTIAAYEDCDYWVDEQREYIYRNYNYVKDRIETNCPKIKIADCEATYLLWFSFKDFKNTEDEIFNVLCEKGVGIQKGSTYGNAGEKFFRVNIGCPRATLEKAVDRILEAAYELI